MLRQRTNEIVPHKFLTVEQSDAGVPKILSQKKNRKVHMSITNRDTGKHTSQTFQFLNAVNFSMTTLSVLVLLQPLLYLFETR